MIGHSLTSFLHPNDIDSVYNQIQKAHEQVSKGWVILKEYSESLKNYLIYYFY